MKFASWMLFGLKSEPFLRYTKTAYENSFPKSCRFGDVTIKAVL